MMTRKVAATTTRKSQRTCPHSDCECHQLLLPPQTAAALGVQPQCCRLGQGLLVLTWRQCHMTPSCGAADESVWGWIGRLPTHCSLMRRVQGDAWNVVMTDSLMPEKSMCCVCGRGSCHRTRWTSRHGTWTWNALHGSCHDCGGGARKGCWWYGGGKHGAQQTHRSIRELVVRHGVGGMEVHHHQAKHTPVRTRHAAPNNVLSTHLSQGGTPFSVLREPRALLRRAREGDFSLRTTALPVVLRRATPAASTGAASRAFTTDARPPKG